MTDRLKRRFLPFLWILYFSCPYWAYGQGSTLHDSILNLIKTLDYPDAGSSYNHDKTADAISKLGAVGNEAVPYLFDAIKSADESRPDREMFIPYCILALKEMKE